MRRAFLVSGLGIAFSLISALGLTRNGFGESVDKPGAKTDINLMGLWHQETSPGQEIRIGFHDNFLVVANLTATQDWGIAKLLYVGRYDGSAAKLPAMSHQDYVTNDAVDQELLNPSEIIINDSNHILVANKLFVRSPMVLLQRPGCAEAAVSKSIKPAVALQNGYQQLKAGQANVAVCWFLVSAIQGGAQGPAALAASYFEGKGVPLNYPEALKWFQQSAYQGYYFSQKNLAEMYRFGIGTEKDPVLAKQWKDKAEDQERNRMLAVAQAEQRARANNAAVIGMLFFGLTVLANPLYEAAPPPNVNLNFSIAQTNCIGGPCSAFVAPP